MRYAIWSMNQNGTFGAALDVPKRFFVTGCDMGATCGLHAGVWLDFVVFTGRAGRSIGAVTDLVYLVGADGSLTEAASEPYSAEAEIQELLAGNIQLLPGAQIDPDSPRRWLLVKREAGVPDHAGGGGWWSVDHLAVDQDAVPTFVEVKRASDTRSRREVVAQMLDYAANGSVFWMPELLRGWFEGDDPGGAAERLADWLGRSDEEPGDVADEFWQAVGVNLREGKVRLVFVADEIPASLQRLVEFLNEQMPRVEVLAVQIQRYQSADGAGGVLVPRLIGQTARARDTKQRPADARRATRWTAEDVIAAAGQAGEEAATVARTVSDWAAGPYLQLTGGRGPSNPSFTVEADSGRTKGSRYRGVLALYARPHGGPPALEIAVKRMCRTPPYNRQQTRERLNADLRALGISRLDREADLCDKRPEIPLSELTGGRVERLLSLLDRWITDVRAHAAEPETVEQEPPEEP